MTSFLVPVQSIFFSPAIFHIFSFSRFPFFTRSHQSAFVSISQSFCICLLFGYIFGFFALFIFSCLFLIAHFCPHSFWFLSSPLVLISKMDTFFDLLVINLGSLVFHYSCLFTCLVMLHTGRHSVI